MCNRGNRSECRTALIIRELQHFIKQFHYEMKVQVSVNSEPSDAFVVMHGTKQGYVLVPTLFSFYLTAVLETVSKGLNRGVFIHTRTHGKLFNPILHGLFQAGSTRGGGGAQSAHGLFL